MLIIIKSVHCSSSLVCQVCTLAVLEESLEYIHFLCSMLREINILFPGNLFYQAVETCVAEQLTAQTPHLVVWGSSLTHCIVYP